MVVFLSLVGHQSTAVIAPLAILRSQMQQIDQVTLLATRQVKAEAQRLAGWCDETFGIGCEVLDISGGWVDEGKAHAPQTVVKEWIRGIGSQQILFNAEPGLNFQVAAVARSLPDSTGFLYPMADSLWSCVWEKSGQESWQQWPLVDLGLDSVLKLYGVQRLGDQLSDQARELLGRLRKVCNPLPTSLIAGLRLQGDSSEVAFDLAFEGKGYLHGLISIEGDVALDAARAVQRITNEFRGLKPRIAVWTGNPAVANRLRRSGHHVIGSGKELCKWALGEAPKPGAHAPLLSEQPNTEARTLLLKQHKGRGGDGPRLVLCMGNDPSTTVLSLTTHRPERAIICYDRRTPFIVEAAWRLAQLAKDLPVGALEFYPTDHLGRGIRLQVTRLAVTPTVRVDVTAGSKAQACALARIPKAEIWSLASHVGQALCLAQPTQSLPLEAPALLVQARARGGDILSSGMVPKASKRESYLLLAQFLAKHLAAGGGRDILQLFANLQDVIYRWGSMRFCHRDRDRWIELHVDSKHATLHETGADGGCFERMVGCILQLAGADEVRCQVKWQWPTHWLARIQAAHVRKGIQPRQPHMDEADVLARFGYRFVAISCKAGRHVSLAKAKREIEAVANTTMGRFCLPILARPHVDDNHREIRKTTRRGAILIDLRDLVDPATFRAVIEEAFVLRSTLAN